MRWALLGLAAWVSGCGAPEASIDLRFPNAPVRAATASLDLYAYRVADETAPDCRQLLERAPSGRSLPGQPVGPRIVAPFEVAAFPEFPAYPVTLFVVGYDGLAGRPLVHGCVDAFEAEGTRRMDLQLVLTPSMELRVAAGGGQVVRPGTRLPARLEVELAARLGAGRHLAMGVPVIFVPDADVVLGDASAPGEVVRAITGSDGRARVEVTAPQATGSYGVEARVDDPGFEAVSRFTFTVVSPLSVERQASHRLPSGFEEGRAIAIGQIVGGAALDAALLGGASLHSPSPVRVATISGVGSGTDAKLVPLDDLGVAPEDIVIDRFLDGSTYDDLAILSGRQTESQAAEIRVLRGDWQSPVMTARHVLTASNGVSLAAFRSEGDLRRSLVVAAQGRALGRPCRLEPLCSSYDPDLCGDDPEDCGCPAGEQCVCPPGESCFETTSGICLPDDRVLDVLAPVADGRFENLGGCQQPVLTCDKVSGRSTCSCRDVFRGNTCGGRDLCGCSVPDRMLIGTAGASHRPYDLAIDASGSNHAVVATEGGIEFMAFEAGRWTWTSQPVVNDVSHHVEIADLDDDSVFDVVWLSERPCAVFDARSDPCPIVGEGGAACLGIFLREASGLDRSKPTGCRRYPVAGVVSGHCVADLDADGALDVLMISSEHRKLFVATGDGQGGLLVPAQEVDLAPANPLDIVCADIDAAAGAEAVVLTDRSVLSMGFSR